MLENNQFTASIVITTDLLNKIKAVIPYALDYEAATLSKRKLGITGELGEVLVCAQLGLRLAVDPRSQGYDAVDGLKLVQIKARRSESGDTPRGAGRVSSFSKHPYDYALLGILNSRYELTEIWRAEFNIIEPIICKNKKRNPQITAFKRVAKRVFPKVQEIQTERCTT